uniref:Uncharacterized protein n=1 Tax=Caenorhabditis japonica TaxID=281687 RepID=A0A8R1DYU7_CAEJA
MNDWLLSIYPSPILPASSSSSAVFACQTIPLGSLLPGTRKTFECHVAQDEPPILLELGLIREFEIDDVRKVFHVQMDPICVTLWDQVQIVRADVNSSFTYRIRLPNTLIDLLSGCPDTVVIPSQVIKAIFNVTADSETVLCITSPSPLPILLNHVLQRWRHGTRANHQYGKLADPDGARRAAASPA